MVIWWGPKVPSSTVDKLEAFYRESPNSMLGTPYRRASATRSRSPRGRATRRRTTATATTAWATSRSAPTFDEKAFAAFRAAFRGKGPEGIPESSQHPGLRPQ